MLEQYYTVHEALERLATLSQGRGGGASNPLRLMLCLRDGTTVEGELSTVADGRVSVIDATGGRREVVGSDLRGVYRRVPNHAREWLVAALGIPVMVGLLAATARLGATGHPDAAGAFRTAFWLGLLVGLPALLVNHGSRSMIGRWFTRWTPMYEARDA